MRARKRRYLRISAIRFANAQNDEVFQHWKLEDFRQMEICDGWYGRVCEDPKYLVENPNSKYGMLGQSISEANMILSSSNRRQQSSRIALRTAGSDGHLQNKQEMTRIEMHGTDKSLVVNLENFEVRAACRCADSVLFTHSFVCSVFPRTLPPNHHR